MKKIFWLMIFSVLLISADAQRGNVIKITGTKFPFDVMQQWIDAFSKTHPGVQFQLSKAIPPDSADLLIAAHAFRHGELKNDQVIIAVNSYAQLPIVNSKRSDLQALQQRGVTKADLRDIYFSQNTKQGTSGFTEPLNVYRRDKNVCASRSFAEHVTGNQQDVAGTLVKGDDRALSAAVKKDVNGISYNNLGLIYNLQTRKVLDSIAVVPVDLNENGKIDSDEHIYGTLDNVLNYLSTTSDTHIPQDNVNIVFNRNTISKEALNFLHWIITNGQEYNRSYGFLSLDQSVVANELQVLSGLARDKALTRNTKDQ